MHLAVVMVATACWSSVTAGQTRVLTGEEDPLKCYTADGVVGDCRPWRFCRAVREEYPKKKPTICLYRPKNPIVCCPRKNGGVFFTGARPAGRPANPWRPIAPPVQKPSQQTQPAIFRPPGKFVLGPEPQQSQSPSRPPTQHPPSRPPTQRPPSRPPTQHPPSRPQVPRPRPVHLASQPSSERIKERGFIGHKDCGLVTPEVRADYDQLELRRRRRSALDRSHASAPALDRSHASAPPNPFDFFDSLEFGPDEQEEQYVAYTELPPVAQAPATTAAPPTDASGGTVPPGTTIRFMFLPPDPEAVDLVYGEGEGGYIRQFEINPADLGNETFVIRTGRKQGELDPYGIFSKEYRDKVSSRLGEANYVTGGTNAIIGRWPWLALIGERKARKISWFCGGTILNERYIITAGHCLGKFQKNRLIVRVGEFDLNYDTDSQHQDLLVDRIHLHPRYRHQQKHHDIALLHLRRPIRLGGVVRPICLPPRGLDLTGRRATVAGWGHTEFGGERSAVLQEAELPIVNTTSCENKYRTLGDAFEVDFAPGFGDTKLCAHDTTGSGKDACQGDSGGPLVYSDPASGRMQLAGIISSGVGCGHPNFPGIYTRVAMYVDWIVDKAFNGSGGSA